VLAFPLYLTVILLTALQLSRVESLATAFLAANAILIPSVVGGGSLGDIAAAMLLAIVLLVAAVAITEVVRQVRETADKAKRQTDARGGDGGPRPGRRRRALDPGQRQAWNDSGPAP
jgi:hypothetical protein